MSFIFDGMSSWSTVVPVGGHVKDFSNPLKTHIQGCISHAGNDTMFYWSLPNLTVCLECRFLISILVMYSFFFRFYLQTGAAFQIHCIHAEIQRLIDSKKPLPKKIYIQVGFLLLLIYRCPTFSSY